MRSLPQPIIDHIAAGRGLLVHGLIWLSARDRLTGNRETVGFWTGLDAQTITVGGTARVYYGAGSLLALDALTAAADMKVGDWAFKCSQLSPEAVQAFRVYDARLAPIEVHLWYCDPLTGLPLAAPIREFRGTVMEVDLPTPEEGGTATASVTCASDTWRLTRGLTLRRSDAALQARAPGDLFRQYNAVSGVIPVAWGEKLATPVEAGVAPSGSRPFTQRGRDPAAGDRL